VEQNGIFISFSKIKELSNKIRKLVNYKEGSFFDIYKRYVGEIMELPKYLHPYLPKGETVILDQEYCLSDEIRRIQGTRRYRLAYYSQEIPILYKYRERIAEAVEKYNSFKAEIIRNFQSFDWNTWNALQPSLPSNIKYVPTDRPFSDGWGFRLQYIPNELEANVFSKLAGIYRYDIDEISRVILSMEYRISKYDTITPSISIHAKKKGPSLEIYLVTADSNPDMCNRSICDMTLELAPMADNFIQIFDEMQTALNQYEKEFRHKLNLLEQIKGVYKFKETINKLKQ